MNCYDDIKKLVSILLAMRDPWDHHGEGVASLVVKMCHVMGMKESETNIIETGAYLHDIGKLRIRSALLNLTRVLTTDERAEMQLHASMGWTIVEQAGYAQTILDIVRYHHERWDGNGYPDKLRGDAIPQAAQITSICDVYQSMTSKRSYREAHSHSFTVAFMEQGRGKHFDPKLLSLFFDEIVNHD